MLNFELLRIGVAVLGAGVAAWQDHKTSFIDDRVVFAMIAAGVLFNLATLNANFILYSSIGVALILGGGYLFYRAGQLGGGDVLLFAGLHLLFPVAPTALLLVASPPLVFALTLPPVVSLFLYSAVFALLGSTAEFALKLRGRKLKPDWPLALLLVASFFVSLYLLASVGALNAFASALLVVVFVPAAFMAAFRNQISKELLVKRIPLKDFLEEDVVELDALPKRVVAKYKLERVATAEMMKKLKLVARRERIRRFPVYHGLPRFAPYVFAALLALLFFGDAFRFFQLFV